MKGINIMNMDKVAEKICKSITDILYGDIIDTSARQTIEGVSHGCTEMSNIMVTGINNAFEECSKKIDTEFSQYKACPKEFCKN